MPNFSAPCLPQPQPQPHGGGSAQAVLTMAVLAALAASVPAQAALQFDELARRGLPLSYDVTNAVVLGDIDGDGDLDLVCGNVGQNRLFENTGRGTMVDVTATRLPVDGDATEALALGDIDGDGDLDIITANGSAFVNGQTNRVYINDGSGTFTDVTATQLPANSDRSNAVALGDVDGDGDVDLVFGNSFQPNRLYLNDGNGTFADGTATQMPPDADPTAAVKLGDFDGDGDLDMVFGNHEAVSSQNRLYENDGSGSFTDVTAAKLPNDGDSTRSLAIGDLDGDGDLDIVLGNCGFGYGQQNRIYVNDGLGSFTDETAARLPGGGDTTFAVVLGDVDGDGDLDLVCDGFVVGPWTGLTYATRARCFLNDGGGTFVEATGARMPNALDATTALALGDVDADGDLDLVKGVVDSDFPSVYSAQNRLYLNLQRQLHAPAAPQLGQPYSLDAYLRYGPSSTIDLAAIYLSTAPASIPLGSLGTLGIDPTMAAPFPTLIIPQPAGVAGVGFTVPNVSSLVGQEIYSQAMLVAYPTDLRLSNVVRDVIQ